MVLKGFFANINMKLKKNLEVMDVGAELSIKSNPLKNTEKKFCKDCIIVLFVFNFS